MPRCYPSTPEFADDRTAERVVWEALREQLPDDAALFHSVGLLEEGREHELDLLIAWPGVGLAVIEVKGGTSRATGTAGTRSRAGRSGGSARCFRRRTGRRS